MIRGYCIGGGTAAAVCCDLRVCTENAKFGVPAAKLGLGYGLNRAQPLVDLIGPAFAKEMFFTGRQFDAREAEKMGLVNRVVADDALEPTIDEMTRTIADNAPLTVRCAKLVVGEALKDSQTRDVAAPSAPSRRASRAPTTRKARRRSWRRGSPGSSAPERGAQRGAPHAPRAAASARSAGTSTAASAAIISTAEIGRMKKMPAPLSEMISDWRSARSAIGPSTSASTSAAGE
jgi:hypothetical protein